MARNKPRKAEPSIIRTNTYEAVDKSIWRDGNETIAPWEYIRGSSYCAVRANIPNLFKEEQDDNNL